MNEQLELIRKICDSTKHENPIRDIILECRRGQPRIVCLCGSARFTEAFLSANQQETLCGRIVLSIGCLRNGDADAFKKLENDKSFTGVKAKLDELHKRKIDLADEVLVLNVGGYIGDSTRSEIEYAKAQGKWVRYLTPRWKCDLGNGEWDHDWQEKHDDAGQVDGGPGDHWSWRECRVCGKTEAA